MESKFKNGMSETLIDFLVREFGEYYIDIIELEFDMDVIEFCNEYIQWDEDNECYVSLI